MDHLFGLLYVDTEIIVSAPTLQLFHLLLVVGLVIVDNVQPQLFHSRISELDSSVVSQSTHV